MTQATRWYPFHCEGNVWRLGRWLTIEKGKPGHKHDYEMVETNYRECVRCERGQVVEWKPGSRPLTVTQLWSRARGYRSNG